LDLVAMETRDNAAIAGGAICIDEAEARLERVWIHDNTATTDGGGLAVRDPLPSNSDGPRVDLVDGIEIDHNVALDGGGVWVGEGVVTLDGGLDPIRIRHNDASRHGGGLYVAAARLTLAQGAFDAGLYVSHNDAGGDGGGVYLAPNGELLTDAPVRMNQNTAVGNGGAAAVVGNGAVLGLDDGGTLRRNQATNGGGISVEFGTYEAGSDTETVIRSNTATALGGGLYVDDNGVVNAIAQVVERNDADEGAGVALDQSGTVTLSRSVVGDNTATLEGGGVRVVGTGTVTLDSTTVARNAADEVGGVSLGGGTLFLLHASIGENTASGVATQLRVDGAISLERSVIAKVAGPPACEASSGTLLVYEDTRTDAATCAGPMAPPGSLVTTGLGLAPFDGRTMTPLSGSPLLGVVTSPSLCDGLGQLGGVRTDPCDIGSVEVP
jgi:hypothetical protein